MKKLPDEWSLSLEEVNLLELEQERENEDDSDVWSCAFKAIVDNRTSIVHACAINDVLAQRWEQGAWYYNGWANNFQ